MLNLKVTLPKGFGQDSPFRGIKKRAKNPFEGKSGRAAVRMLRTGPGSAGDQFNKKTTIGVGGNSPWPPTKKFGKRPRPRQTLVRSGNLKSAWLGRHAASRQIVTNRSVKIAVDSSVLPYANIVHRGGTVRAIKLDDAGERSAMHWFLGLNYGVWIAEYKLAFNGLKIPRRAISLNTIVGERINAMVMHYISTGKILRV